MNEQTSCVQETNTLSMMLDDVDEGLGLSTNKYLSFLTGGDVYGIPISRVKEIIEYGVVTRVPMVPDYIRGVINLRGSVVPIIDLSSRLGLDVGEVSKRTCIVIIEVMADGDPIDIGVLVDGVNEVLDIVGNDIEESPSFGVNIRSDFVYGIGKAKQKFVIILDIDQVISIDELSRMEGQGSDINVELF